MGSIFTGGQTEATLAHYAEFQGASNSCGEYSVAAGLSLLKGEPRWMSAEEVVRVADSWTLVDSFLTMGLIGILAGRSLRMWKGGPTTSWQVANLARRMAGRRGMHIDAVVRIGSPGTREELIEWLKRPNVVVVVTIAWDNKTEAVLEDPHGKPLSLLSSPTWQVANLTLDYTAHVMVLVAHDSDKNRWGFINSWVDGTAVERLYWISDEDFEETWGYSRSPLFIPRMWVTISNRD